MTDIKQIEGGICASEGFLANGVHAGIKKNSEKKDLAIIYSKSLCSAAAVYTQNKACGANITVSKEHLKDGKAKAVICNSGNGVFKVRGKIDIEVEDKGKAGLPFSRLSTVCLDRRRIPA